MPVLNMSPKPLIPINGLRPHLNGVGAMLKPLGIGMGQRADLTANVRQDLGRAVQSLIEGLRRNIAIGNDAPSTFAR